MSSTMSLSIFVAAETKYTILVSTVTALVTLYLAPVEQMEGMVTPVRADCGLAQAIELSRIPEHQSASE